jgi:prepilin-type N-terminal cleavage/methylation domain-containing protein
MFVRQDSERGDTLIEVILALAIFAIVTVGAFAIINKGAAQMYDSLERTQVRLLIDRQSESLIYARDQYLRSKSITESTEMATEPESVAAAQVWTSLSTVSQATPAADACSGTTANAFYIIRSGTTIQLKKFSSTDVAVAAGMPALGNGLYIQYANSPSTAPVKYKDFYLRACWQPTSNEVRQTLSTVVRLYESN